MKGGVKRWALIALFFVPALLSASSLFAGETIIVTSERLEAYRKEKVVIFKGNVEAREDFLMCSDELRLRYGEGGEVREIEARGNVRIYREDSKATSRSAHYDRAERKLVLTGDAEVERCADTVKGDRVTYYLDTGRALVDSGGGERVRAVIMPGKKCTEKKAGPVEKVTHCKRPR